MNIIINSWILPALIVKKKINIYTINTSDYSNSISSLRISLGYYDYCGEGKKKHYFEV